MLLYGQQDLGGLVPQTSAHSSARTFRRLGLLGTLGAQRIDYDSERDVVMFAPLDNEDSATSLVLRRHASRQRQHFSRCRACSEQMMPRVVAMTPTPDSRVRVAPVESPKTEPSASCVSTSP